MVDEGRPTLHALEWNLFPRQLWPPECTYFLRENTYVDTYGIHFFVNITIYKYNTINDDHKERVLGKVS